MKSNRSLIPMCLCRKGKIREEICFRYKPKPTEVSEDNETCLYCGYYVEWINKKQLEDNESQSE